MRILITGAGGQVGRALVGALAARGHEIHAGDITPVPGNLPRETHWHRLDVTDASAVVRAVDELRPQRVFHLAGILSAKGEADPLKTYHVNQGGMVNILEACRRHERTTLMFTSSIAVFGADVGEAACDDSPCRPRTMYGLTKVNCELLGEYYHRRYHLDFRALRFPGLIGLGEPGGGSSDYAVYMFTRTLAGQGYQAFCRPDTRIPLMYLPDGIAALLQLSDADPDCLTQRVYNVAAFSPTAWQLAEAVQTQAPEAQISFQVDSARQAILDHWPRVMDDGPARRDWRWQPRFDLPGMARDLLASRPASSQSPPTSETGDV